MAKKGYKQNAITLLRQAEAALDIYASEIFNIHVFGDLTQCSRFEQHNHESNFTLQKQTKMQLLNSWKNDIENSVKKLEDLDREGNDAVTEMTTVFTLSTTEHSSKVEADEMYLLYDYGLSFVYEVKQKPKFCFDALICFLLGAAQILAGILVCGLTCGAASQFGLGLISEGVSDMVAGIEGMIKGTFSWAQWAISKAISIGVSLATAGFKIIMKGSKAMCNITKDLLNGTRSFCSLAKDTLQSGKIFFSSAPSHLKSLTSSATRDAVIKSIKGLATNPAAKKAMLEGAKHAGRELISQNVSKAMLFSNDAAVKEALKKIIFKCFLSKVNTIVKNNKDLEEGLINFIVTQVVPEAAKDQSMDYEISLHKKESLKDSLRMLVQLAVEASISQSKAYNEVQPHLDNIAYFIMKIPEAHIEKVKLCACIAKSALEIADLVKLIPIEPIINDKIIHNIVSDISERSPSVKDRRREFKEVIKLKEETKDLVSEEISKTVIGLLVDQVSSLLQRLWQIPYVNKNVTKLTDKAKEWLNKTPQTYFCNDQNMKVEQNHRNGEQDTQIKPEEAESHITKLLVGNDPNLDLELSVLTKSDLIGGRGVKMISIKDDGTTVSTEYYPGKNSSSETIVLQVKSSHSGKLKFRTASSEGHKAISKWRGLYDAISQVSGGR
ncbi:uncharacterized protein LOC143956876 [Lithobates pipiens]